MIGPVPPARTRQLEALLLEDVSPQMLTLGLLQAEGPSHFQACIQDDAVVGIFYLGQDGVAVTAAVKSRAAAMEIGEALRRRELRRLLGTQLAVAGVMAGLERNGVPKVELRLHQVTPDDMGPYVNPSLRKATGADLPDLLQSLEMAAAEEQEQGLSITPELTGAEMDRLREQITRGRIWLVDIPDQPGEIAFRVEVEAESRHGAHLGGIYTHPDARGRGLASLCMGQLARHMLARMPRLSAFVPTSNPAAQRVVRKVGFGPGVTWTQVELG
ncbi:MAG: GNAT family N-acetyltransferase [Deltaproteobacteria bacterium]|nr:GNAT family N-acetyltransferase [Deltaproteobacteria bacterium]